MGSAYLSHQPGSPSSPGAVQAVVWACTSRPASSSAGGRQGAGAGWAVIGMRLSTTPCLAGPGRLGIGSRWPIAATSRTSPIRWWAFWGSGPAQVSLGTRRRVSQGVYLVGREVGRRRAGVPESPGAVSCRGCSHPPGFQVRGRLGGQCSARNQRSTGSGRGCGCGRSPVCGRFDSSPGASG